MIRRALLLTCLALSSAQADEVFLRRGGRLRGHVVQGWQWVEVLHARGSLRVEVEQVTRVRREPRGRVLWLQARAAQEAGHAEAAARLLRKLLTVEDGSYALRARRELELRDGLRGPVPVAELSPERAIELAWRAVAAEDFELAKDALLQATAEREHPLFGTPRGRYLLGRIGELRGDDDAARWLFQRCVGDDAASPVVIGTDALRWIAQLHAAGYPLELRPPGHEQPWRLAVGPRSRVLHVGDGRALMRQTEHTLRDVSAALGLPRPEAGQRVLVVAFPSLASYRRSAIYRHQTGGFAHRRGRAGEVVRGAVVVEGRRDTLRHELAHLVTLDAFSGHALPSWVVEGSAMAAESSAGRQRALARARTCYAERRFGSFAALRRGSPHTFDALEPRLDWYAKVLVAYQALVRHVGHGDQERVFEFALDAEQVGIEIAYRRAGLTASDLHRLIRVELEAPRAREPAGNQ